jgi:hypothetical protein
LVELVGIFDMQGGTGGVVEGFVDFGGVFHGLVFGSCDEFRGRVNAGVAGIRCKALNSGRK